MKTLLKAIPLIVLLTLSASAPVTYAQGGDTPPPTGLPRFERLFEKEGWAQSSFHCAIQDRTGFLWFCTADGLLRYDGYSLKVPIWEIPHENAHIEVALFQ